MQSLSLLMCAEAEEESKRAYFGNALWLVIQYASMGKSSYPQYGEIFGRQEKDERSAGEIIGDILKKLGGDEADEAL